MPHPVPSRQLLLAVLQGAFLGMWRTRIELSFCQEEVVDVVQPNEELAQKSFEQQQLEEQEQVWAYTL